MPTKLELLEEANARGILPPDKKELFDEAVRRGLIKSTVSIPIQPGTELQRTGLAQGPAIETTGQEISTIKPPEAVIDPEERQQREAALQTIKGIPEAAATVVTGAIAEPIAGITGIVGSVLPGEEGQGAEVVEKTREALTFKPRSDAGKKSLSALGGVVEPIAKITEKMETGLGDIVFKTTNSPALAAAAATIPTIISEAIGVGAGKAALGGVKQIKNIRSTGKIAREIKDAVPDIDQLKSTARAVYKEIDETGAIIGESSFSGLTKKLSEELKKAGLDPDITPKASKALKRFEALDGSNVTITELDTLRKVAQNAAKSLEPAEAALGVKMINTIDDFLDNAGPEILKTVDGKGVFEVGKKYKIARDLWGRARKSELLQESFTKARNQASGFENGIRVQFRSILNSKKKRKFFKPNEIEIMTKVVQGGKAENFAKLVGKLGFSEGGATGFLGGSIGVAGGAAVGGPAGAVIVPLIGQVSRKLAQRMTIKGAEFAGDVIRAGKDAKKITQAYLKNTAPPLRNPAELSELLMTKDIDLSNLPKIDLAEEARKITMQNRKLVAGTVVATEAAKATQEEE